MLNSCLRVLTGCLTGLILSSSIANAAPTLEQYIQRRLDQFNYGAAANFDGSVNQLYSSSATPYPLNKALWLLFDAQPTNPYAREWIEIGGGKGKTALSMSVQNPQLNEQYYYEGHYMAYQRFTSDGSRWYNEGRVLESAGVPSGDHRYKIQRNMQYANNWCGYVNNVATYCITMVGANNYNKARYTTIGIESQDDQHSFMSGTGAYNIWHYPTNASGFQILQGDFPNADNNNRGWDSLYFPYGATDGNNAIGFYHP